MKSGDAKGAFGWLQFHNAPFEGDSQYYGAALAAVAIGHAPGGYKASPAIAENVAALRAYLGVKSPAETLMFTEQKRHEEPAS